MSNNIRHLIIQPMNEPKKIEQMSIIQQKKKHGAISTLHSIDFFMVKRTQKPEPMFFHIS
jgi:hypothetical protein